MVAEKKEEDLNIPKQRRRKIPVSPEERQLMLWWWTVYGGNYNKTAKKVSEITGIERSRKVVFEIAKRHNFRTMSHIVRDQVNKQLSADATPGMNRMMKLVMDLMEIDEELLSQAKTYLIGGDGKTKFTNVNEVLGALKYVTSDLENITGKKGIKSGSFEDTAAANKPEISISVQKILSELPEDERDEVVGEIIDIQTNKILDFKK